MFRCLSPGALGVNAGLEESLRLAKLGGFQGVEVGIQDIAKRVNESGAEAVKDLFASSGLRAGVWGLPVNWQTDDSAKFDADLKALPGLAAAGAAIGCTRCATYFPSWSDSRDYDVNLAWYVERFAPIARVLADHGCSLGLEFLGPKTLRANHKYDFVHDIVGGLDLGERIGPNVGLLLDCWHWHTAGNTVDQIRATTADRVVHVHVNDAPAGIPNDEQIDNVRCLPGETGVIDIAGFLGALREIGYDGPVMPEPFSAKLKGVTPEEAIAMAGEGMAKIWSVAGL